MNLLITSVDALVDTATGKPFPGVFKELDKYLAINTENVVAVISIRASRLKSIPEKYNPIQIPGTLRGSGQGLLDHIASVLKLEDPVPIILGAKEHDMFTASHLSAILLTAVYSKNNNPKDRIFTKNYGIPISNVDSMGNFFDSFYGITNPWYFKVKVDPVTTMYALTNANTWGIGGTPLEKLKTKFRECLKEDNTTYIVPFTSYFLVSIHLIQELKGIDYWDIYPSSESGRVNEDLLFFAQKASHSFNREFNIKERLLVRKDNTTKRHETSTAVRIVTGCDNELSTMVINPFYKGKLKGKSVAIIDDFTRIGSSSETVRLLLQKAGVAEIVFIAMGKFGTDKNYYKYDYEISGNVHSGLTVKKTSHDILEGTTNIKSNHEFLESLRSIV